jgi:nitrogen fixation NifU-like protein
LEYFKWSISPTLHGSLLTEWVRGKTLEEAAQIKNTEIAEELALLPVKINC